MLYPLISALLLASTVTQAAAKYVYENFQSNQVGLIRWQSWGGTHMSMRSYHIDDKGIRESSYNTGSTGWSTIDLGIPAHGDIVAGVHKYSEDPGDVIVRLFFQNKTASRTSSATGESLHRMVSFYNDRGRGWKYDVEFEKSVGFVGKPRSVVSWVDPQGVVQWRLYYLSVTTKAGWSWQIVAALLGRPEGAIDNEQLDVANMYLSNSIYEASLSQSPSGGAPWKLGNGGSPLDTITTEPWGHIGVTAVAWAGGSRISVLYWQNIAVAWNPDPGSVREKRWKDNEGWVAMELPNNDFKFFQNSFGSVAAVTWVDSQNIEQIRLYVKWVSRNNGKNRLVEFSANDKGWGRQSSDFPDYAAAGGPMAAVAWTTGNDVHIRIHSPKCNSFDSAKKCQSVIVGETSYDGGEGWQKGRVVDGKTWATY